MVEIGSYAGLILDVGSVLYDSLKGLVCELVRQHGDNNNVVTREQLGGGEESDWFCRKLALIMRHIADDFERISDPEEKKKIAFGQIANVLHADVDVQRIINNSSLSPTKDTFMKIAEDIFSDGRFNWSRVSALYYLACQFIIKDCKNQVSVITESIINWPIDLQENAINWMREEGGWEGIRSHYGSPTWQTVGVVLVNTLTTVLYKNCV